MAPSNLGVVGRYVLEPVIFDYLEKTESGAGSEIQLTDAIEKSLSVVNSYACTFDGIRFDCGSKKGFVNATLHYAKKQNLL